MFATITTTMNTIYNATPAMPRLKIDTPSNMLYKAQQIALPAILVLGTQNAQCAEGAFLYCLCLAACAPLAEAPPLLAICIAACTPLLNAP